MTALVVLAILFFCAFGIAWLFAPHRTNGYLGAPGRRWFRRHASTGEKALALHVGHATKRSALR